MEPDGDLDPDTDDLPLRANTSHILVRHYVLDLTVDFDRRVIGGSVVLFLEPGPGATAVPEDGVRSGAEEGVCDGDAGKSQAGSGCRFGDVDMMGDGTRNCGKAEVDVAAGASEGNEATTRNQEGLGETVVRSAGNIFAGETDQSESQPLFGDRLQTGAEAAAEDARPSHTDASWESSSEGDFTLVLDCCDLTVTKVEELDINSVSAMSSLLEGPPREGPEVGPVSLSAALIQKLLAVPSGQWRQQHQLFRLCSRASRFQDGLSLRFHTDRWSLQVRKKGVTSPQEFPRAIRVCYETRPTGGSVRWTKDQDNRLVTRST